MQDRKEKTALLWDKWKKDPSKENLGVLLKDLEPIIYRQTSRWSGVLSPEYMNVEGKVLAVQAINDYDPNRGTALSTHVSNRLQKLSRPVYMYQNVYRLSEPNTLKINSYKTAMVELEDDLGRPPTSGELAARLGWSISFLQSFRKELRGELIASEPRPIVDSGDKDAGLVHYVYSELNPSQQTIFDHMTGFGGAPQLSPSEIQKKLSLTPGQFAHQKRQIIKKFEVNI